MRVLVLGVLLARTLNAQVSDGTVTALDEPAPLITPGADALAESDLVGTSTDATLDDSGATAVGGDDASTTDDADLPTGTADVIVEETQTDVSQEPATTDGALGAFGAGGDEGAGADFNGSEFDFPAASDAGAAPEETTTTDDSLPEETDTTSTGDESTVVGELGEQATPTNDLAAGGEETAIGELGEQATPTEATPTVDAGAGIEATADPFGNLAPEKDLTGEVPEATPVNDFGAESPEATPVDDGTGTDDLLDAIPTESTVAEPEFGTEPTGIDEGVDVFADATPAPEADGSELGDSGELTDTSGGDTGIVLPDDSSATPVSDDGVSSSEETTDPSLVAPLDGADDTAALPEQTDPAVLEDPGTVTDPGTVEEPIEPPPIERSSTIDLGPTPLADPLAAPQIAPNLGGALSGGVGAAYADDDSPGTWTGEDVGNYDSQDIGDKDCPASCYEDDEDDSYGTSSTSSADEENDDEGDDEDADEDDEDYGDESLVKKVVRWISRRALGGSDGGFAAFSWPIDQKDKTASYDPEDSQDCEDIPEWLYESSGKKPDSCPAPKANCPAKCYEHGHGPKPYPASSIPGGYETSKPDASTSPAGYSEYNSATDVYSPYPDYSTTGYYESTTSSTQTTFVTSTTTVPGGHQGTGAQPDYTGDTLAGICPKTCDPFNPAANKCDITSSCTTTGKGKYYCACRAGYRASAWNAKDFSKQFKFPDQPYVYTAEGVVCDKVCSDQTCTEVLSRPQCQ